MRFLIPQGIGDSTWALHKIQAVAAKEGDGRVDILINCSEINEAQCRAMEFVRRFRFVQSCDMVVTNILADPILDGDGHFNYIPDGWTQLDEDTRLYALMPNGPLERGVRLEQWLPQYSTNWNVCKEFRFLTEDAGPVGLARSRGPYAVFFMGSLHGNTTEGHNRGPYWEPEDWVGLGDWLHDDHGLHVVVVGASYDLDYFTTMIEPLVEGKDWWRNEIAACAIGETFALCREAQMVVAYQSGIGIFSHYLGVPVAIFWRPKGDSTSPHLHISFEESMASAWSHPDHAAQGRHLPLIYGRHDLAYLRKEIEGRGWVKPRD